MKHNDRNFLPLLEPIIKTAGEILLSYFRTGVAFEHKLGNLGLVTEADIASERYLIAALAQMVPGAAFLAEESGVQGASDYCWVIDPLDGTTNFAHGLPYFCISVALTHKGMPVVGVIYQPMTGELFYAQQGKGAFLNGTPITVSKPEQFCKSAIVIGLPYAKNERYRQVLEAIRLAGPLPFSVRHFGAAALDLAQVACGRMDGVILADLAWWDIAAGMLLITEAQGVVTDFKGGLIDRQYTTFVASGAGVHAQLIKLLKTPNV